MFKRRPRRPLRAQPIHHLLPNLLTIIALCLGLTAIRYGLDGRFELAVALIVLAAVLDGLDGYAARMLRSSSRLGAQLDSLADFLSFGVAPALLVYLWTLQGVRGIGWALALLFAACCALRLARFNTELDDPQRPRWAGAFFTGMPAPAAAGCVMLPMIGTFALEGSPLAAAAYWLSGWPINAAVTIFVALMMVSRVPTLSLKRVRVQPDWVLATLLVAGLFVAFLATAPWATLLALGVAYVLSLPVGVVMARRARRREEAERAAAREPQAAGGEGVVNLERRSGPGR